MDAAAFTAGRCRKTGSHTLKDTNTPPTETRAIVGEQLGSREMALRRDPEQRPQNWEGAENLGRAFMVELEALALGCNLFWVSRAGDKEGA